MQHLQNPLAGFCNQHFTTVALLNICCSVLLLMLLWVEGRWGKVSYRPGWPWSPDPSASIFDMLEVQVYVTKPGLFLMYFTATCRHQWLSSLNSLVPISLNGFTFIPSDTGDWTQGLLHCRHMIYPWATHPAPVHLNVLNPPSAFR